MVSRIKIVRQFHENGKKCNFVFSRVIGIIAGDASEDHNYWRNLGKGIQQIYPKIAGENDSGENPITSLLWNKKISHSSES